MAVILKRLVGEAGAGLDEGHGFDSLYDVLAALVAQTNDLTDQFNVLVAEYTAETAADHTASAATVVTKDVSIEA